MAKKGGDHRAFSKEWFLSRGYSELPDGSFSPPPVKSGYIKSLKNIESTTEEKEKIFELLRETKMVFKPIDDYTHLGSNAKPLAVFNVNPIGKPRMTQRDKWDKRKNVQLYWKYKADLLLEAKKQNFNMPNNGYHIICYIQMPHSWPDKKKNLMNGSPHQQKPDKDNIEKGILDALLKEDSCVWDGRITKYWGRSGKIAIYNI